jgi:hypothetical protein
MRESEQLTTRPEHERRSTTAPGRREAAPHHDATTASTAVGTEQGHLRVLAERARCAGIAESWQDSARIKGEFAGITKREILACSEVAAAIARQICEPP